MLAWRVIWHFSASMTSGRENCLSLAGFFMTDEPSFEALWLEGRLGPKRPWRMAGDLGERPGRYERVFW